MNLFTILILSIFAIFISFFRNQKYRESLLLISSILVIYWLQPDIPIRFMDFWLPTMMIFISIISWQITNKSQYINKNETVGTIFIICAVIIAVSLTRYINLPDITLPVYPPQIWLVIVSCLVLIAVWNICRRIPYLDNFVGYILVCILIGLLIIIKYPNLNYYASQWLRTIAQQSTKLDATVEYIKWLGFSYMAFRIIHTIRDRQANRLPDVTMKEYVIYILFFPAITAGPIDRIERFIKDLRNPYQLNANNLIDAGVRISSGLFKKFIIADTLSIISLNNQNALQIQNSSWLWIFIYAYTFQIYFDFSGYTDIAIGISKIMGIDLPENFKKPYLQQNITQFWNNWHITLTQWFRSYYFFPLTRWFKKEKVIISKVSVIFFSQISTMILIGMWHGITINFLCWGLWQGIGLFIHNQWSEFMKSHQINWENQPLIKKGIIVSSTIINFHYIALGWVWFAVSDIHLSLSIFQKLIPGCI